MKTLAQLTAVLYRLFSLAVLASLLVFPAYKGVWLGYVPVALGAAVAILVHCRMRVEEVGRVAPNALPEGSGDRTFLLVLLLVQAALQVGLLLWLRPEPWFDGRFVYQEAAALAGGAGMSPLTYYPPAQTWWYALFFKLFGASPLVAQLAHLPLSAAVTLAFYFLARRCVAARAARALTFVVALYPSYVGYILATPYYHYLYTALTLAMCACLLRGTAASAGAAGFFAGWGALAKATQLIAPAQALAFWLLRERKTEDGSRKSEVGSPITGHGSLITRFALFLLGMLVVVGPWTARNWRVFGELVPVCTSGGLVLHSANNPASNGLYSDLPDAVSIGSPREMLDHSRASSRLAREFIVENPGRFAQLAATKFLHTWGNESTFTDLINRRGIASPRLEQAFSFAFLAGWSAVAWWWALAAWRALRARAAPAPIELLAAIVVLSNALVYVVFEGGDRHHLPFVPLILLAAAAGCGRPRPEHAG